MRKVYLTLVVVIVAVVAIVGPGLAQTATVFTPDSTPSGDQVPTTGGQPAPAVAGIPEEGDWTLSGTVLTPAAGTWEDNIWAGGPYPVVKVDGVYYLYYGGADGYDDVEHTPTNRAIGVATSTDGRSFTKHAGNPIVTYSTAPQYREESATNPVVLYEDGTWHMWYGAGRAINPSEVDIDIRYRTSTDGLTWTGDTLVFQSLGDEYIPINAFREGPTYYLYMLGPLTRGNGALRLMSGSDPAALSGNTLVASGPFKGGNGLSELDSSTLVMHISNSTNGNVQAYTVRRDAPAVLSGPERDYTFSGYARHSILPDGDSWLMYQLDITGGADDGNIVLRTTGPVR
jgi:hypothetical protein